ncbi:MAG: sortase [Minisyncoccales bacterium]
MVIIFNWSEISWLFNYKAIGDLIDEYWHKFFQRPEPTFQYPAPATEQTSTQPIEPEVKYYEHTGKPNSLEIPKIKVEAPLVFAQTPEQKTLTGLYKLLDYGVVHYPESVLPGENGQTILLGHSAGPGWPHIKYDWVFSDLNKLEKGDEVFVNYNQRRYHYTVVDKLILERGAEIPAPLTDSPNVLVLVSCWPPGRNQWRIAIVTNLLTNF